MKKNDRYLWSVCVTGYSAVILQCLIVREFLSIFFGNELILGIIFSLWLLSSGIGSYFGHAVGRRRSIEFTILLFCVAWVSLLGIRLYPLFFSPGSVVPAFAIALLFVVVETPPSFLTGYVFGLVSKEVGQAHRIYFLENAGVLAGTGVVFCVTLFHGSNMILLLAACVPLPLIIMYDTTRKPFVAIMGALCVWVCITLFGGVGLLTDAQTGSWKYAGTVSNIRYTREGELATRYHGNDTIIMLNNMVYKSTLNQSFVEQAVHIPVAQHAENRAALVILDRGHHQELTKYPGLKVDILETIPAVAPVNSIITTVEHYRPDKQYDLVFLGSSLPDNVASCRYYTKNFYQRIHTMMTENGVLSFTVPYNENFMPAEELMIFAILRNTLQKVFRTVLLFPGSGYVTCMASDGPLHIPDSVRVQNEYLSSFILPALSKERIALLNQPLLNAPINTNTKPVALYISLKTWMRQFGFSAKVLFVILGVVLIGGVTVLPHGRSLYSVMTSGFAVGFYSIAVMINYQATYGDLYGEIALLLMAMTLGFVAGSRVRHFPLSDFIMGGYIIGSLVLLGILPNPPVVFFLLANFGIGLLSAAQFVTRKEIAPGILNSADLFGGVFGMALSSTVLIPLFGIVPVACGVLLIKIGVGMFEVKSRG